MHVCMYVCMYVYTDLGMLQAKRVYMFIGIDVYVY